MTKRIEGNDSGMEDDHEQIRNRIIDFLVKKSMVQRKMKKEILKKREEVKEQHRDIVEIKKTVFEEMFKKKEELLREKVRYKKMELSEFPGLEDKKMTIADSTISSGGGGAETNKKVFSQEKVNNSKKFFNKEEYMAAKTKDGTTGESTGKGGKKNLGEIVEEMYSTDKKEEPVIGETAAKSAEKPLKGVKNKEETEAGGKKEYSGQKNEAKKEAQNRQNESKSIGTKVEIEVENLFPGLLKTAGKAVDGVVNLGQFAADKVANIVCCGKDRADEESLDKRECSLKNTAKRATEVTGKVVDNVVFASSIIGSGALGLSSKIFSGIGTVADYTVKGSVDIVTDVSNGLSGLLNKKKR